MENKDLFGKVETLRVMQKKYFTSKEIGILNICSSLEKEIDLYLSEFDLDFLVKVAMCRYHQKLYFESRKIEILNMCILFESKLDLALLKRKK